MDKITLTKTIFFIFFIFILPFSSFAEKVKNGKCFFRPLEFQKIKSKIQFNKNGYDKHYCRYGEIFVKFPKERMINPSDIHNKSKRWVLSKTEDFKILDNKFKRFIKLDEFNFYSRSYDSCLYQRKEQQELECIILKSRGKTCSNKYQPPFYGCVTSKESILYDTK